MQRKTFCGWHSNAPRRIVPKRHTDGHWIRVVRGSHVGVKYELGYNPTGVMIGDRLRRTRRCMLMSLWWAMNPPEPPDFTLPPRPRKAARAPVPLLEEMRRAA